MPPLLCARCHRFMQMEEHFLEITVEDETTYLFCLQCVRNGFDTLSVKDDKTIAELDLLRGLTDFLKSHRIFAQA